MSANDPRRPDKVIAFHIPPATEEEASDWNGNMAMVTALGGVFLRNKVKALPWISGYFGLSSLLNGRKSIKSNDSFSGNGALLAVVSLSTYYINVYMDHKRAMEAYATGTVGEGCSDFGTTWYVCVVLFDVWAGIAMHEFGGRSSLATGVLAQADFKTGSTMGKATKPKQKYQINPKNISKHANSVDPEDAKSAKERMEAELHLLKLRKQSMASPTNVSKPSKTVIKKKAANLKKQKRTARALLVAEKEEARIQRTSEKQELRKVRKRDYVA